MPKGAIPKIPFNTMDTPDKTTHIIPRVSTIMYELNNGGIITFKNHIQKATFLS
jgi:hypothetical protein